MKVMVFVKTSPEAEIEAQAQAGKTVTEQERQERAAMDHYNDELVKAGIRRAVGGLQPSRKGARINLNGNKVSVTDGPFAETKELVAGFWIWEVRSMEEAIEWASRCPFPTGTIGVLELCPFNE